MRCCVATRSKQAMASGSAAAAASAADAAATAPVRVPQKRPRALADANKAGDGGAALDPQLPQETLQESIKRLKEQQAAMKAAKKEVQRELRNATKRRHRLKKQARQLTDKDLVEVLQMRKEAIAADVVGEPTAAAAALRDEVLEDVEMMG